MGKLQLFRENFNLPVNIKDIEIIKDTKLIESKEGGQLRAFVILKNQPYGAYTKGLNGRTYSESLWRKSIQSGMLEGIPAIESHLDNPMPSRDVLGLWKNHRLTEKHPVADFYVTDERLARNLVEGIRTIGISTSGYGEIKEGTDGFVDESTFTPVSIDVVFNPSMEVYLSNERIGESVNTAIKESKETNTNKTIVQSFGGHTPMDKFTEAQESLKIKTAIDGAKKVLEKNEINKFSETIEGLDFYISVIRESGMFADKLKEMSEIREKISDKINEDVQGKLKTLEDAKDKIKELTSVIESQNQKLLMAEKLIEEAKKSSKIKEEDSKCNEAVKAVKESYTGLVSDFKVTKELAFGLKEQLEVIKSNYAGLQKDFVESTHLNLYAAERIEFLESKIKKMKEEDIGTPYEVDKTADDFTDAVSGTDTQSIAIDPAIEKLRTARQEPDFMGSYLKTESVSKKKEVIKEDSEKDRVKKFVESQISKTPVLAHVKKELLERKSVEEVIEAVEKFKEASKDNGPVKLQEDSEFNFSGLLSRHSKSF